MHHTSTSQHPGPLPRHWYTLGGLGARGSWVVRAVGVVLRAWGGWMALGASVPYLLLTTQVHSAQHRVQLHSARAHANCLAWPLFITNTVTPLSVQCPTQCCGGAHVRAQSCKRPRLRFRVCFRA